MVDRDVEDYYRRLDRLYQTFLPTTDASEFTFDNYREISTNEFEVLQQVIRERSDSDNILLDGLLANDNSVDTLADIYSGLSSVLGARNGFQEFVDVVVGGAGGGSDQATLEEGFLTEFKIFNGIPADPLADGLGEWEDLINALSFTDPETGVIVTDKDGFPYTEETFVQEAMENLIDFFLSRYDWPIASVAVADAQDKELIEGEIFPDISDFIDDAIDEIETFEAIGIDVPLPDPPNPSGEYRYLPTSLHPKTGGSNIKFRQGANNLYFDASLLKAYLNSVNDENDLDGNNLITIDLFDSSIDPAEVVGTLRLDGNADFFEATLDLDVDYSIPQRYPNQEDAVRQFVFDLQSFYFGRATLDEYAEVIRPDVTVQDGLNMVLVGGYTETSPLVEMERIYNEFVPNPQQDEFREDLAEFYWKSVNRDGFFHPGVHLKEWIKEVQVISEFKTIVGPNAESFISSIKGTESERVMILLRIFILLVEMIETLQLVAAAQSERLRFYANYQSAYTNLIAEIPVVTEDELLGFNNFNNDTRRAQLQGALQAVTQAWTEKQRSFRSVIGDEAQQHQTTVNQSNEIVTQQANLGTSILQQMSTILTTLFK